MKFRMITSSACIDDRQYDGVGTIVETERNLEAMFPGCFKLLTAAEEAVLSAAQKDKAPTTLEASRQYLAATDAATLEVTSPPGDDVTTTFPGAALARLSVRKHNNRFTLYAITGECLGKDRTRAEAIKEIAALAGEPDSV